MLVVRPHLHGHSRSLDMVQMGFGRLPLKIVQNFIISFEKEE